jgi:hypothetical protein
MYGSLAPVEGTWSSANAIVYRHAQNPFIPRHCLGCVAAAIRDMMNAM